MNNIAVLLTCHNRKEITLCCLHSLFACPLPENYGLHVYLVDDGSTDGTADAVKDNFPRVKVIQGNGNLFWNRGMNLAWKTAAKERDYDFYLWINDDTNLYPNFLAELLETSQIKNNQSIICGSTCAISNKENITYGGRKCVNKQKNEYILLVPNGEIQECDYINGNIALIPKYVFKKLGLNDVYFWHGFGDWDYGLRAKKAGLKSFVPPNTLGECNHHAAWKDYVNHASFYSRWKGSRNPKGPPPKEQFRYNRRHFGFWLAVCEYIHAYIRILLSPKLRKWIKLKLRRTKCVK